MTNEEAIELIKVAQAEVEWSCPMDYAAAFDLAIKALEQEPCEDCISRQAVKDMLMREWIRYIPMDLDVNLSFVLAKVDELPLVTPQYTEAEIQKMQELEQAEIQKAYELGKAEQPCEDCISRQAVEKITWEEASYTDALNVLTEVREKVRALPPVTPQPKIGHCKGCKHFEYDSVANVDGVPLIVAHEICSRWGDGCKTSEDGYCFLFEPKMQEVKE